jgi:signal recognition particle subunit SRP72
MSSNSVSDEAVRVIATLNKIAAEFQTEDFNPYSAYNSYVDAAKNATSLAARPFGFQSRIIHLDEVVLNLSLGKTDATEAKSKEYHNLYPSDKTINVVNAAAQTAGKAGRGVIKKIEQMVEANSVDIGLALTLVQLRMNAGNITGSIAALEFLFAKLEPEKRYQPGLVGLLVALYEHQGRKLHVKKILAEASDWWKQSSRPVR